MGIEVTEILDVGSDKLLIRGTTTLEPGDPPDTPVFPLEAEGSMSAITNHYDLGDYLEDGHRKPGSTPRMMTEVEVGNYARSVLQTHLPLEAMAVPVKFK